MAVKRKGIVARPGVHHNILSGLDEVVTWEELVEAVKFQNRIPLVLAHPQKGYINPNDRIGTVRQFANDKKKVIEGEFWFFDEPKYWDQIPLELKRKIIGGQSIDLSAGYKVGPIVDGRQTSRQYDHIALDVKNPMFDVGIEKGDVRMESELPKNFRIEETPAIEGAKPKETKKEEPVIVPDKPSLEIGIAMGKMQAQIDSLQKQLEEAQTKPVVEETTEETRPEAEPVTEPSPPKPKTVVPLGSAKEKDGPDEDGQFRIST